MLEDTVIEGVGESGEAAGIGHAVWASNTGGEVQEGVAGALTYVASGH